MPSRWLTPSSSPTLLQLRFGLGDSRWVLLLALQSAARTASPLFLPTTEASSGAQSISMPFSHLPWWHIVSSVPASGQPVSISLAVTYSSTFLFFSHHPISTSALSWHPLCADRTQQLLHLSGSLIFGEILVICLVPQPLQWVGPHLSKNFALWLPLECFFFFKPLTVSAFYSSSATSWIPLLFCVSWTVLLSFSYVGSSSQKDRRIHAIQKLFKPTQC